MEVTRVPLGRPSRAT